MLGIPNPSTHAPALVGDGPPTGRLQDQVTRAAERRDPVQERPEDLHGEILNLRELERRAIHRALERTGGCMAQAARLLGIGRATIYRKLASFAQESREAAE